MRQKPIFPSAAGQASPQREFDGQSKGPAPFVPAEKGSNRKAGHAGQWFKSTRHFVATIALLGLIAAPVWAQPAPTGWPPGVTPPVFVVPASAVNGAGTLSTTCLTFPSSTAVCEDAANILAQRNGTNAQTFYAYNTYTSATNYERLELTWSGNIAYLLTRRGSGGGSARALSVGTIDNAAVTLVTTATERWDVTAAGHFVARTDNTLDMGASGATRARNVYIAGRYYIGGSGTATSANEFTTKVTAIADNTATDVLTVTIPNGNHAASLKLTFTSSNGSTDAFESTRTSYGQIVVARTTGVNAVATAAALTSTAIATVAAGATHTFAYNVSAIAGAADASNTFTVQVTIDDSGNLGSNQVVVLAELVNAEATGITVQ